MKLRGWQFLRGSFRIMRRRYQNFHRQTRKQSVGRAPRRRNNSGFTVQLLSGSVFAGVLAWNLAPQAGALYATATSSPAELEQAERSVYYYNCDAARAAGASPIHRGEPGYRDTLDGDDDGVACEPYY